MKNIQVINLLNSLPTLNNLQGAKFAWILNKNKEHLLREAKVIQEKLLKIPPELETQNKEFEEQRIKLNEKHAEKDTKGNPIKNKGNYIIKNPEEFAKEFTALEDKYSELTKTRKELVKKNDEYLQLEASIILHKIKMTDVPQNISVQQMDTIIDLIEE